MNVKIPRFECFRAGKQIASDGRELQFTEADLAASAKAYDPAKFRAPIVIGHPKQNGPAYGWIGQVSADGELMYSTGEDVEPEFAEMVKNKRIPNRSMSFYTPTSPSNPVPGVYYPRHIAFLGATPPAIKGLKDIEFAAADDADLVEIEFTENEAADEKLFGRFVKYLESKFVAKGDRATETPSFEEQTNVKTEAELKAEREALDKQKADQEKKNVEFAEREKALADKEKAGREKGYVDFIEGLVKAGKLLPRQKSMAVALLASAGAIAGDAATVEFTEGEGDKAVKVKKPAAELLQSFLGDLPKQVDFKERSKSDGKDDALDFADASVLSAKAQEYVAEQAKLGKTVNIAEAVAHVKSTAAK